jgi:choline dehydrogenase
VIGHVSTNAQPTSGDLEAMWRLTLPIRPADRRRDGENADATGDREHRQPVDEAELVGLTGDAGSQPGEAERTEAAEREEDDRHAVPPRTAEARRLGVGENCRDHLHTRVSFECRRPITLNDILRSPLRKALMGARFLLTRGGHMAACTTHAHALAKTDPALDRPDVKIQMHNLSAADPRHPTELRLDDFPGFGIGSFALRPHSTGSVHARSPDPEAPPAIVANYLADERDRRTSIAGLRLARRIAAQPALRDLVVREVRPGPAAESDDALLEHIAALGATSYHPIGTCKMGADPMAVVDERLRVRGIRGLRVADASIMPTMVSPNTNAPSFMIGERCAQFLLDEARANATPENVP